MRSLNKTKPGADSIGLFIAGARGQVGSELMAQIEAQQPRLAAYLGLHLKIIGTANTEALRFAGEIETPRKPDDWDAVLDRLQGRAAVFVDCTASVREDTARKLVIMLRDAGSPVALENVSIDPLLPADALAEPDPIRCLDCLGEYDADWRQRAAQGPLACLARYEHGRASVEWTHVEPGSPFVRLEPRANRVHIHTVNYTPLPLAVAGPGAGTTLTAAGILSDIIHAARALRPRTIPVRKAPPPALSPEGVEA